MLTSHDDAHWAEYNDAQQGRDVRQMCGDVLELAGPGAGRTAVDIGCGLGVETAAMLGAGWRVHAIDREPGTPERVRRTVPTDQHDRLTVEATDFADLTVLPAAGLVHAGYSLPYVRPGDFERVWSLVRSSLGPGTWLAANLFGVNDTWATELDATFLTEDAVHSLVDGMEVVQLVEEDEDGMAFSGPKHWHVFTVIARV